jgi:hypothetical protein
LGGVNKKSADLRQFETLAATLEKNTPNDKTQKTTTRYYPDFDLLLRFYLGYRPATDTN